MEKLELICQTLADISQLEGSGSQEKKIQLLKDNDCEELRYVLEVAYHPFKMTHINKLEMVIRTDYDPGFEQFKDLMERLFVVKAMNDVLRKEVNTFIANFNIKGQPILEKIITKSLNIGIGAKLINKALETELIPDFEMMKAEKDPEIVKQWFKEGKEVFAEDKLDGVRVWAKVDKGRVVQFATYDGREIDLNCMKLIALQIEHIVPLNKKVCFVDGELTGKDRQSVSGLVNKILKGTAPEDIDKNFIYHIFDYDSWGTIERGVGKLSYELRKKVVGNYFHNSHSEDITNVTYVRKYLVKNYEQLLNIFNEIVQKGGEGLIAKLGGHKYETKRSKSWVKMKSINDCELKIVEIFKGKIGTKRENTIGGFVCVSRDERLRVEVGGGFSDVLLQEIAEQPNKYIGKIATVKYNVKSKDKYGNISLFLPRLKEVRFDKFEANWEKEIE